MSRALGALLALHAGCGPAEEVEVDLSRDPADYAGPAGMHLDLVSQDDPDGTPLMLRVSEALDSWETRAGERWADGTDARVWAVLLEEGLRVDEVLLLPPRLSEGTAVEGVTVTALGEREVWYGRFSDTVSVEVAEGPWAGEQAFALGVGPILLTWGGAVWELGSYEGL